MWLRILVDTTTGAQRPFFLAEPSWLMTADIVGPYFVYGAIHGLFVRAGLTRAQTARAIARRYLVTYLVAGAVGLALGLAAMAVDS